MRRLPGWQSDARLPNGARGHLRPELDPRGTAVAFRKPHRDARARAAAPRQNEYAAGDGKRRPPRTRHELRQVDGRGYVLQARLPARARRGLAARARWALEVAAHG